jgi:hypothetical protein
MAGLNLDNWIYKDITYINTTRKKKKQKKTTTKNPCTYFEYTQKGHISKT